WFTTDLANGGLIFWGTTGVLTSTSGGNLVRSLGGQVIFHGTNAGSISVAGNASIIAQTPSVVLTGLDLADPDTIQLILGYQQQNRLGGNINLGTLILRPENLPTNTPLTALTIPLNNVVTVRKFTNA